MDKGKREGERNAEHECVCVCRACLLARVCACVRCVRTQCACVLLPLSLFIMQIDFMHGGRFGVVISQHYSHVLRIHLSHDKCFFPVVSGGLAPTLFRQRRIRCSSCCQGERLFSFLIHFNCSSSEDWPCVFSLFPFLCSVFEKWCDTILLEEERDQGLRSDPRRGASAITFS